MGAFGIFAIVVVVLALLTVFMGVQTVSQGYEYTVARFGRYTRTLPPGLHIIVPSIDRIGSRMNMMEHVLYIPSQETITRDHALVGVDGVVFYPGRDPVAGSYEVRQPTGIMPMWDRVRNAG